MSVLPEEFSLLAFNGFKNSDEMGAAFLSVLKDVGTGVWDSDKLKEPNRRRVYIALRDIEPAYRAFLTLIEALPWSQTDKERLHFRLVKLMDDLAVVGSHAVLTPAGRKFAQGLQANDANEEKSKDAALKNRNMWPHIQAEAVSLGRDLVDSDECGRELEKGVRARMGVDAKARGFSYATIRKQIRFILKERQQS